jgi:predicted nicotinamide N-methyase
MDGLRLTSAPLVPEVRLFLAEDPTILWARLQAGAGGPVPAPFWASAWTGGQAVARYVLDHPETVAGRRVLDLASGSGIVAIAAALAGATLVTANDIDPGAAVAIRANAEANAVDIVPLVADILDDGDTLSGDVDVVLAGDVLYNDALAPRVLAFLTAVARQAAVVLVGDPGRGRVPSASWDTVATYPVSGEAEDALITGASVLRPAVSSPAHARAASTP